jgi:uncharacterized membrane protein
MTEWLRKISPKVYEPLVAQSTALLVNVVASGKFDRAELAQILAIVLTAALGYRAPAQRSAPSRRSA